MIIVTCKYCKYIYLPLLPPPQARCNTMSVCHIKETLSEKAKINKDLNKDIDNRNSTTDLYIKWGNYQKY